VTPPKSCRGVGGRVCIFHNRSARFVNHSSRNLTVLDDPFFFLSQKVPVHGWKSVMVMAVERWSKGINDVIRRIFEDARPQHDAHDDDSSVGNRRGYKNIAFQSRFSLMVG
jgi:hypothetical protein